MSRLELFPGREKETAHLNVLWTFSDDSIGSVQILVLFYVDWSRNHAKTWSGGRFFIPKDVFLMKSSVGTVLESLVLKNDSKRASQHVKRTSGARVMIMYFAQSTLRKVLCAKYFAQSTLREVLSAKYFAQSTLREEHCAKYLAQST